MKPVHVVMAVVFGVVVNLVVACAIAILRDPRSQNLTRLIHLLMMKWQRQLSCRRRPTRCEVNKVATCLATIQSPDSDGDLTSTMPKICNGRACDLVTMSS